jgi:hypothetical protein
MAEQRWRPAEAELEQALVVLGSQLAYPPTPDLVGRVGRRLAERPRRQPAWATLYWTRRLAYALVVLLAFVGGLLAVWPEAREAVAERLGLRGIVIFQVPAVPTPPSTATPTTPPAPTPVSFLMPAPTASPSPTPGSAGARLGLGQRMTLQDARARAPFQVVAPTVAELGPPDEVYFGEPPLGGQVSLVWRPRPGVPPATGSEVGLLLTQFQGELDPRFYAKAVGPGTRLEELTVQGGRGVWLEGSPHFFIYRDRAGRTTDETIRLAGNVLLWEQGALTVRLEAALSKDEALRVAQSVR